MLKFPYMLTLSHTPPRVYISSIVAGLLGRLTIGWGNQEVELVSKVWLAISPPPSAIAMPARSLVINLVVLKGRLRIRSGGIVLWQAALGMGDGAWLKC